MGSILQWPPTAATDNNVAELCNLHNTSANLWCLICGRGLCGKCEKDHPPDHHPLTPIPELSSTKVDQIQNTTLALSKLMNDLYSLDNRRQNVVLKLLEAIGHVKADLEAELMAQCEVDVDFLKVHHLIQSTRASHSLPALLTLESNMTATKSHLESFLHSTTASPFNLLESKTSHPDSYALLHSYLSAKCKPAEIATNYPKYYIDLETGGNLIGRIVIATRPDIAPRMCENFKVLIGAERGVGYRGCSIFQCWKRESVITGDFEYNNGRGGYSIFNKNLFLPEDTKLLSSRGAIGMRRTQKRHDSKGLVGSQFRIILQDMPGFTGIFGHVVQGLGLVDKISEYGDNSGNPTIKISILDCGVVY